MMKFIVNNLTLAYKGDEPLISNFSTEFEQGQFVALIGRNGSGKSTLLRHLAGHSRAASGEILLDSTMIGDFLSNSLAKKISWIGSGKTDFLYLNVEEYVSLGRHPHLNWIGNLTQNDREIISDAIELMDISHLKNRMIGRCSDGERQNAMLARALAQDTKLILLDEVTAHLDFVNRHKSFNLLKKITEEKKKLVIIATHEIDLALHYCSDIYLFHDKKIQKIETEEDKKKLSQAFDGFSFFGR